MTSLSYGYERTLTDTSFEDAKQQVTEALGDQGFGVLTEIDIQATMKKKLDEDYDKYVILGACNPALANEALTADPNIGLLLPCNVVVRETDDGVSVAVVNPHAMFSVVDNEGMEPIVTGVDKRLKLVLEALSE